MKKFCLSCLLLMSFHIGPSAQAQEVLPAYNTYYSVPFVVGEGGLAKDMVTYLNSKLKGKYQFNLQQISRETLNKEVIAQTQFKGAVLFLSPFFVGDSSQSKFLWTAPVLADSNVVISLASHKIEYAGPEVLYGLKFGGVRGNRYAGLEEHFGKEISREDVAEELSNIKKLASGRINATIMASSTYRFLLKQMGKDNAARTNLYTSPKLHAQFERHFFVAKDNEALGKELSQIVQGMKTDPAWNAILTKYDLE